MGSRLLSRTLGWTSGFRCRDEVYFSSTMPLKERRKNTVTFSLFFNEIASDWTVASSFVSQSTSNVHLGKGAIKNKMAQWVGVASPVGIIV